MTHISTELDNPWKDVIERFFEQFMDFFFPKVHQQIDFSRGYEFLDKELQKVVKDAKMKRRLVDKLVKVWLMDGKPVLLYIHIEVQGQYEEGFAQRVYVYHYRLFDRYGSQVMSLVILGDNKDDWRPKSYSYKKLGCELELSIFKKYSYKNKK